MMLFPALRRVCWFVTPRLISWALKLGLKTGLQRLSKIPRCCPISAGVPAGCGSAMGGKPRHSPGVFAAGGSQRASLHGGALWKGLRYWVIAVPGPGLLLGLTLLQSHVLLGCPQTGHGLPGLSAASHRSVTS